MSKDVTLTVTPEELAIVRAALRQWPDPENYDFGPAYGLDKERSEALLRKIDQQRGGR